jgi:hypothetical protein
MIPDVAIISFLKADSRMQYILTPSNLIIEKRLGQYDGQPVED